MFKNRHTKRARALYRDMRETASRRTHLTSPRIAAHEYGWDGHRLNEDWRFWARYRVSRAEWRAAAIGAARRRRRAMRRQRRQS